MPQGKSGNSFQSKTITIELGNEIVENTTGTLPLNASSNIFFQVNVEARWGHSGISFNGFEAILKKYFGNLPRGQRGNSFQSKTLSTELGNEILENTTSTLPLTTCLQFNVEARWGRNGNKFQR